MKRYCTGLVAGVLLAGLSGAADLPQIQQSGTLRVLVRSDSLPEMFRETAQGAPGLEREILDIYARQTGVKLKVVFVRTMDELFSALTRGEGDLAAGGLIDTEQRRRLLVITTELIPVRHVVLTRKPHAPVTTLDQLRTQRVGAIKGSSWVEEIRAAGVPTAQVNDKFATTEDVLAALRKQEITAMVLTWLRATSESRRDPQLEIGLILGKPTSVGFVLSKDSPQLLASLNKFIGDLRPTATWNRLVVKYFGESALEVMKRSRQP